MILLGIYCTAVLHLMPTIAGFSSFYDESKITNCPDCKVFPPTKSSNYSDFSVIYQNKSKSTFFVGARDGVLQMTLDAQLEHFISVPSVKEDYENCLHIEKTTGILNAHGCSNVISLIVPFGKSLMLACGSNADQSKLCWPTNGYSVGKYGEYLFHRDPAVKYVVSGDYVYQGWSEPGKEEKGNILRSKTDNSGKGKLVLKLDSLNHYFVSVYEFGNFIYYFFVDASDELPDQDSRLRYARVGRVCKYDKGGELHLPTAARFRTFSKARLLCRATKNEEIYYNYLELTSTITDDDGKVYIYGLFRSPNQADNQYAVCRYSLSEIEAAFDDKKYYEITSNGWKIVDAHDNDVRHKTCNESLNTRMIVSDFGEYKNRLSHVATILPDGKQPVTERSHTKTIRNMLADFVVIANKSFNIIRLFDSNLICEVFVPVSSFGEGPIKTFFSVRKISEDPLTVNDVALIKDTGDEGSSPSPSAMPTTSTTTIPTTTKPTTTKPGISTTSNSVSTTSNLTSTQLPLTPTSSKNMSKNLTDSDGGKFGNSSTTTFEKTTSPLSTKQQMAPNLAPTSSPATTSDSSLQNPVIDEEKIVVAATEKVVIVPVTSCYVYSTCRECVAAMNPYCAWHNDNCVRLTSTESGAYIQDIEEGNYSKVCPPVDVSCELVKVGKMMPTEELTLQCLPSGIPTPHLQKWTKNNDVLSNQSDSGLTVHGNQLKISNYTLTTAGKYACYVSNGLTSRGCSFEIQASKPTIECSVVNKTWLKCRAIGYPEPVVLFKSGVVEYPGRTNIEIKTDGEYEFIAYNSFGFGSGGIYRIIKKSLKFKINDLTWSVEFSNKGSKEYLDIEKKVLNAIKQVFKDNDLFVKANVAELTKGSVVATVEISGLKTPNSKEGNLSRELEEIIQRGGKLGDFSISKVDDNIESTDQKSTPPPSGPPSARDVTSPPQGKQTSLPTTSLPTRLSTRLSSTPLPASTRLPSTRMTALTSRPVVKVLGTNPGAQTSSSSGVAVWLLVLLLILISTLVFFVGYFCGFRGLLPSKFHGRSRRCTNDSSFSDEDDAESKGMSRSEKGRESQMKLLRKHEGKKQCSEKKNSPEKGSREVTNTNNTHGSAEIEKDYDDEEDNKPNCNQSVC